MSDESRLLSRRNRLALYVFFFAWCVFALAVEAYYDLNCDDARGTVRAVGKTTPRRPKESSQYHVDYDYVDAHGDRHAGRVYRDFFPPQPGTRVEVQYFRERPDQSRLMSSPLWTPSFIAAAVLLAVAFVMEVVAWRRG